MSSRAQSSEIPDIQPFWQRIPKFFLYPMHVEPLLYIVFLSLATLLGFILPAPAPFDSIIVNFLVWLAFVRYGYQVLDQTSRGLLTPNQHRRNNNESRTYLPYKQYAVIVIMGGICTLAAALNPLLFGVLLVYCTLAMPASVMVLSVTESFFSALNPLSIMGMMQAIGLPYLGLCAFLFMLGTSQQILQSTLLPRISPWLFMPMVTFVGMYFTLIMFNMMGYVLYQYHHMLGLSISDRAHDKNGQTSQEDDQNAQIGRLIAAGELEEALELAYEAQRTAPDDINAHERYHKLLGMTERQDRLVSHAHRFLILLLYKQQDDKALALYQEMRLLDSKFEPEQSQQIFALAQAARRKRDFKLALALIKGFDKRIPRPREIPEVYLFAAKIFSEDLHQDAHAKPILKVLLERYPEHEASLEAQKMLAALDRFAQINQ